MSELTDLYQELILDHYKRPRNAGALECETCHADGHNPLCGDRIKLHVRVEDDVIRDIRFEGAGCAISTASASLMTEAVKGKSRGDAEALGDKFHALVTGESTDLEAGPPLGKLEAFLGVRDYPARVKCATLAWHTLEAALEQRDETVTTE